MRTQNDIVMRNKRRVLLILLDLSAALDMLHNVMLLACMTRAGVIGVARQCFQSFLTSRTQTVYAKQPVGQPASRPAGQPASQPASRPASQPAGQSAGRPVSRPASQPAGQSAGRPVSRPASQPAGQSAGRPVNRPASQPVDIGRASGSRYMA